MATSSFDYHIPDYRVIEIIHWREVMATQAAEP
jgi:hypothetical protein